MPLRVLPLREVDLDAIVLHAWSSYPGDDLVGPPNPLVWPVSSQKEAWKRLHYCMEMQRRRLREDPTCNFLKVVDMAPDASSEDDAEIVSVARWHRYDKGYEYATEGKWETATLPPNHSPGGKWPVQFKREAHDFILAERDSYRETWIPKGEPVWILMHLVTRPSWRGRGAAAMLIKWGQERAAAEDACAFLEAGEAAQPLYEHFGFQLIGETRCLSLRSFGLNVDFRLANMRWTPNGRDVKLLSSRGP